MISSKRIAPDLQARGRKNKPVLDVETALQQCRHLRKCSLEHIMPWTLNCVHGAVRAEQAFNVQPAFVVDGLRRGDRPTPKEFASRRFNCRQISSANPGDLAQVGHSHAWATRCARSGTTRRAAWSGSCPALGTGQWAIESVAEICSAP